MSTPGTPAGGGAATGDADPLRTIRATTAARDDGPSTSENSPLSTFKRRQPSAAAGPSGARDSSPGSALRSGGASNKRSFSGLFGRKPSNAGGVRENAPRHLSMPPGTNLDDTLSPSRRRVSTRRISGATGNPVAGRALGPLSPISPGGTLGRRIQDWQSRSGALSPNDRPSSTLGEEGDETKAEPEVIVPKMLPGFKTPEYQTPLPIIAITVLAIIMIGEFMSANLASPFLFPMLEDYGTPSGRDEASIGFWAGIVSCVFFLSQFTTAVIWGSIASKFGRRFVLFTSLLGNTTALIFYGTSKSVTGMIVSRLLQGAFNGAVGVAKTAVKDLTDSTNEGRAYAVMGLCWSLGGIIGPVIGGWTEHPVENIPSIFGNSELFRKYPYLLPTMTAGSVTLLGAVLCLFLSPDGGPREGTIRLPEEKDIEGAVDAVASLPGSIRKRVSGYFGQPGSGAVTPREVASPLDMSRRTSFAIPQAGSAYGYSRRDTGLSRFRRLSAATASRYGAPDEDGNMPEMPPLNLAQRLLLANDEAGAFNISDIWLASATRDEADPYGGLDEDPFADDDLDEDAVDADASMQADPFLDGNEDASRSRHDSMVTGTTERHRSPLKGRMRAGSVASTVARPAIYQNTGLSKSPITAAPIYRDASAQQSVYDAPPTPAAQAPTLAAIPEGRPASTASPNNNLLTVPGASNDDANAQALDPEEKHPLETFSFRKDLPITLIAQYAVLGFHGTTMDQIFVSYLVTKPASGGLGLAAGDYANIIAVMSIFQMLFQFRFYPLVSLPAGRLTHLQMFRLGLYFYIILYSLFPELRPLLGPNGEQNSTVTFSLILLTAMRYLAGTCSYTAVMILVNAMTAPAYLPLANGLAQSCISLARFFGPLFGGVIWSNSIADGPGGYYIGFLVVAGIAALGLAHSYTIR